MMDLKHTILEHYAATDAQLNGIRQSPWHSLRERAVERFRTLDFPTQSVEEWKHLNIKSVLATPYTAPVDSTLSWEDISSTAGAGAKNLLVFVNGHFKAEWSKLAPNGNAGVVLSNLRSAYAAHADRINTHLGAYIPADRNAFVAANTACMSDGAFVHVAAGQVVEHELCILNVIDARTTATLVQPRHLILLERDAKMSIAMRTVTFGAEASLTNQVTECVVDANAELNMVLVQDDSNQASVINAIHAEQHAHSRFNVVTVSLSGDTIRNDVGTRLAESGAEAHMYGVYCLRGTTAVDNHTVMDHATPHCHSNELYKGILDGRSRGVFNGKIYVRKDAQKTLAYQSNRNVLLSDTATINTKPQLEILADDVKCSHGCTVGKLDEEALFYLQARGIGAQQARALLLTAFAEDVTSHIENEGLRSYVNAKIEAQLLETKD